MDAARQLALHNGAAEIFLQTARDNAPARALYEKLGYVQDETVSLGKRLIHDEEKRA